MINQVILMGRYTKDMEVRYSQSGDKAIGRVSIAVERDYKKEGEEKQTDFINLVAFGKTAEFMSKHFRKGSLVAVIGRIQTGSYTNQDGKKVYTTDIVVEKVSFTGEKQQGQQQGNTQGQPPMTDPNGFMNIPANIDEELPFN